VSPVAVVTDTTHYLPRALVEASGLHLVSLYVRWQDRQDREADLASFDEYYEHLRTAPELPTTSQPSVGDFLAVYEPLLEAGHDVVSIHLSAGISGTCNAAEAAHAELAGRGLGSRVEIVDSKSTCAGLGLPAVAAAAEAAAGGDLAAVVARAHEAGEAMQLWFCLDTMEFLRRGGRVGAARAWLGSTLKIKPILSIESEVRPVERVRTAKRAFERMVEYLESLRDKGSDGWVVQHIQAPEEAERLVERGREVFGSDPVCVSEVGPVVGTHTGPGLLGVGGLPRSFLAR